MQLKLGIEELGKIIGQEPDYKKLRKAIELENQIYKTQLEIFEIKKAIPCPVENIFNVMSAAATIYMSGRYEFYEKMLQVSKERYDMIRYDWISP